MTSTLLSFLESFNRKERFFLVGAALGRPLFELSDEFREMLRSWFGASVPTDAFVAMDYHIDWLQMSIWLAQHGEPASHWQDTDHIASGNQEDIDLVVAFDSADGPHLILIEAKVDTGWNNAQLKSKARRLAAAIPESAISALRLHPHYGLMSPKESPHINVANWPQWMTDDAKPRWHHLGMPAGRRQMVRCDSNGKNAAAGGWVRIDTLK